MIKRSTLQENISFLNLYVPKKKSQKTYSKKLTEKKREIENSTIILEILTPISQ